MCSHLKTNINSREQAIAARVGRNTKYYRISRLKTLDPTDVSMHEMPKEIKLRFKFEKGTRMRENHGNKYEEKRELNTMG